MGSFRNRFVRAPAWRVVMAAIVTGAAPLAAQGTVSGRVTLLERPGETTTDLGNTVISLEPAPGTKVRLDEVTAQMPIQGRQFSPRVVVITMGSKVAFPNQDPFNHNVFSSTPGALFDLGLYARGGSKQATFRKPGAFAVYCNIHARMTGFVVVLNTPWYVQPGADGGFTIPRVPAGTYTAHFWHERAPEQTREIEVTAAGLQGLDAELDARGYKFVAHKNKFGKEYTSVGGDRY
jgi:plastocyanin